MRARQILFGGRWYNSGIIETAPSTKSLLSRRSAPIGSHSVIPLIIPPLRQRTDTPGSAPLDFPRKHAIFLSNTHFWYGFNSLLSRGSWVRIPTGAPFLARRYTIRYTTGFRRGSLLVRKKRKALTCTRMSKKNQTKLFERVADGIYQRRTGGLCWRPKKDGQRTWEKLHHHYRSQGRVRRTQETTGAFASLW